MFNEIKNNYIDFQFKLVFLIYSNAVSLQLFIIARVIMNLLHYKNCVHCRYNI